MVFWFLLFRSATAVAGDAAIGLRDSADHPTPVEAVVGRVGRQGRFFGYEGLAGADLTRQPPPAAKASVQDATRAASAHAFHERYYVGFQARGTVNEPPDFGWYVQPWVTAGAEFRGWKHYRYHNFDGGGQVYTNDLGWGIGLGPTAGLGLTVGYSKIHVRAEVVDRMLVTGRPLTDGTDAGVHLEHLPTFGVYLGSAFDGRL